MRTERSSTMPDRTFTVIVRLTVPRTATPAEAAQYIMDAVTRYYAHLPTEHPMADLDPDTVEVESDARDLDEAEASDAQIAAGYVALGDELGFHPEADTMRRLYRAMVATDPFQGARKA